MGVLPLGLSVYAVGPHLFEVVGKMRIYLLWGGSRYFKGGVGYEVISKTDTGIVVL